MKALIDQNLSFRLLDAISPRFPGPKVVQVCIGNASTRQIANLLQARFDDIERFVMESNESVFMLRE